MFGFQRQWQRISPRTALPPRRTWGGLLLAMTLAAVVLWGGGGRAAEAATAPSAPAQLTAPLDPGYEFEGFRWSRTVIPVYYTWEGGTCVFAGNNFTSAAPNIPEPVLLDTLQTSIAEINANLRGGLVLQLSGLATRAELCSTSSTKAIVIGFGTISSTGQALSYGTTGSPYSNYTAARVFLNQRTNFSCPSAPTWRDLQHTMTHELLHAIGVGHSSVASAIMAPTFVACRTPQNMQADDIAAVNALYAPTLPAPVATATPTVTPTPTAIATPTPSATPTVRAFLTPVTFSAAGQSLTVFPGGTIDDLESAARAVGATGIWVQDAGGTFRLLVVNGPAFLRDQFRAAFPSGLPSNFAVTLVR